LACTALASCRLRAAYLRQLEGHGKRRVRWWRVRRPPVGRDALRWKERHVEGVAPLAVLRGLPSWLGVTLVAVATVLWSGHILLDHLPTGVTPAAVGGMVLDLDVAGLLNVLAGLLPAPDEIFRMGAGVMLLA